MGRLILCLMDGLSLTHSFSMRAGAQPCFFSRLTSIIVMMMLGLSLVLHAAACSENDPHKGHKRKKKRGQRGRGKRNQTKSCTENRQGEIQRGLRTEGKNASQLDHVSLHIQPQKGPKW